MIESEELLAKADALLARWRSAMSGQRPPADYPVLTEIVDVPEESAQDGVQRTVPAAPAASEPVPRAEETPLSGFSEVSTAESAPPAPRGASDADEAAALEERIRARVLDAIEPHVGSFLEQPFRVKMEDLARRLAADLAQDARREILGFLRDAVRRAVAQELESRRDSHTDDASRNNR